MAEIKNTFLKSKMNKDLDDRLLPNGEYRDAQNISVGKSEDADVGALENIIGNAIATPALPYDSSCSIIGYYVDKVNNRIITFVTNYTDLDPTSPTYVSQANLSTPTPTPLYECHICVFNQNTNSYTSIVSGDFLNFSTTDKVLGVSLIEQLLFFTDNRNQPRKININTALQFINEGSQYYTSESQISVAKYNPYEPISLVKKQNYKTSAASVASNTLTFSTAPIGVTQGDTVVARNSDGTIAIEGSDYVTVDTVSLTSPYEITLKTQIGATTTLVDASVTVDAGAEITFLSSTMSNKENVPGWPGDPDLLEDKYVRFSYRFKFDDGEYSLIAPFTQIAYVPKQKGYLHNGDEDASYRSTIIEFMENEINNIELLISLPSKGSNIKSKYKIESLDILYKESDALTIKVLETISASEFESLQTNIYSYEYQSRKPYKTLAQFETTRVYDKIPVRALAQETSGNRVIYGNFRDQNTPPKFINYYVGASNKNTNTSDSFIEYPNHTLKQNRNYQIGFILADKFGRQSPVVLSPVSSQGVVTGTNFNGGSTIYHPYNTPSTQGVVRDWFGDQLQVVVNSPGITSDKNLVLGTPGLYAEQVKDPNFTGVGFAINSASFDSPDQDNLEFNLDSLNYPQNGSIPRVGDYLRGEYVDYVKVISVDDSSAPSYIIAADGSISSKYLYNSSFDPDIKFAYTINQTGWYSYKVVVKQTEQEYYNCYLPGILNGYPDPASGTPFPTGEDGKTAHVVLLNDNINKIPRDLSEVGPDQKQYRSSVQLFGRVENTSATTNQQYYPSRNTDTASTIATANDLNMSSTDITTAFNFYQLETNPLIARISTLSGAIGVTQANMQPFLAVYETEPVISLLDIFWETSTAGLISDLNEDVLTGSTSAVNLTNVNFIYNEDQDPSGSGDLTGAEDSPWITDFFTPLDVEGAIKTNTGLLSQAHTDNNSLIPYVEVINNNGTDVSSNFVLYQETDLLSSNVGYYRVRLSGQNSEVDNLSFWGNTSLLENQYTFTLKTFEGGGSDPIENISLSLGPSGSLLKLNNKAPYLHDGFNVEKPLQLPLITEPQSISTNEFLGTVGSRSNGAHWTFSPTNWAEDVGIFLTTVPALPTPYNSNSITINHLTGGLTTGWAWSVGYYTCTLTVKDAMTTIPTSGDVTSQGVRSQDSEGLNSGVYTQTIRIVPGTIPSGLQTTCLTTYNDSSPDLRQFEAEIETAGNPNGGLTYRSFGWYVAESTLSVSDMPITNWPYGPPVRLGTAGYSNTAGVMQLDLMVEVARKTIAIAAPGANAYYYWTVYYRSNSSSSWSINNIFDSNNSDISDELNGVNKTISTDTVDNIKSSSNIPLAFSRKGEYFIVCTIRTREDLEDDNTAKYAACWVNANDANYPSCVPLYGNNFTSSSGYFYNIDQYNTANETPSGACSSSSPKTAVWGRTPYGHIVSEFFDNSALTDYNQYLIDHPGFRSYNYNGTSQNSGVFNIKFGASTGTRFQTSVTSNIEGGYNYRAGYVNSNRQLCPSGSSIPTFNFLNY